MLLELQDICFERDNKKILKNINLELDIEKFIAITGPNGSGKSTLVKIIMGIEKQDSGSIIFNRARHNKLKSRRKSKLRNKFCIPTTSKI